MITTLVAPIVFLLTEPSVLVVDLFVPEDPS